MVAHICGYILDNIELYTSNGWIIWFCCCSVTKSSCAQFFETPRTAAHQSPLSSTLSQSLLKFRSIELVMLTNHLLPCHPFSFCLRSFPASGSFPMSWLFSSGGQSIGASASASVLPIQGWDGLNGKESACNAGDLGSIPGLGRSPREGNGNPL